VIDVPGLSRIQDDSYARAGNIAASWPRENAMDGAELRGFIEEHTYCVLATANERGRASARPVAYTVLGTSFWFATVAGRRLRDLEATPWASIVVASGDRGAHRAIVADGPVTITRQPPEELLDAWERRHSSRADWAVAWFEVRPARLLSYAAPAESR
jgi:nitroimidazol reductase NimA-like FMN-containing flavoprotein (pyridoxamine 5'-phosphate oxidase superfamily)